MHLHRIVPQHYAGDLSGEGARIYGGRWNPPGIAVVYTSETVALALLEVLANVPHQLIKSGDFHKVTIEVPENATIRMVAMEELPGEWKNFPPPSRLAAIGAEWLNKGETLLLRVPCAVTGGDGYNYLINPSHPQASSLRIVGNNRFSFDSRILMVKNN